jgi:hypothetical protein
MEPVPELIAYAKANPGKITMRRPAAFVSPFEPLRAEQRKALEKTRRGWSARSNSIGDERANSINKSSTQLWLTLDP